MPKFDVYNGHSRARRFLSLDTLARAMGRGFFSRAGGALVVKSSDLVETTAHHPAGDWVCTLRPRGVPGQWLATYTRRSKRADWFPQEVLVQIHEVGQDRGQDYADGYVDGCRDGWKAAGQGSWQPAATMPKRITVLVQVGCQVYLGILTMDEGVEEVRCEHPLYGLKVLRGHEKGRIMGWQPVPHFTER